MLRVGQKLWWVDRKNNTEGYVLIAELCKDEFHVWYNGKIQKRPYSVIGEKLFFEPQLSKPESRKTEKKEKRIPVHSPYKAKKMNPSPPKPPVHQTSPKPEPYRAQPPYMLSDQKSCDRCVLRRNGTCSSLANNLCDDYRPAQHISQEELDTWPEYGDALAYRFRNRSHFKD